MFCVVYTFYILPLKLFLLTAASPRQTPTSSVRSSVYLNIHPFMGFGACGWFYDGGGVYGDLGDSY